MAGKSNFSKSQVVREELDKSPNAETQTIARKLCRKHPKIWPTVEDARNTVRYVRGAIGKQARRHATHTRPITVPKADDSGWAAHELPSGVERWLILADVHFPYHSAKALKAALEFGRSEACDGVLINGDLMDFYKCSFFEKDPSRRSAEGEIECTNRGLDSIQEAIQPKAFIFKGGNHEARMPRYLMQRVPEMFEVIDKHCNMDSILGLERRGIKWIHDKHIWTHRDLTGVHGHEWGRGVSSPVNAARGAYMRAMDNVLQSDCHRTSEHVETNIRGLTISCWSTGCLCDLHPDYRPIANKWNHGFGILHTGKNWSVKNYRIIGEKKVT